MEKDVDLIGFFFFFKPKLGVNVMLCEALFTPGVDMPPG